MTECHALARALLVWLSRQTHQPDPLEFLATPDGSAVMPRDLEQPVARLQDFGLVHCHGSRSESRLPHQVSLSRRGRDSVQAFAATMAAYDAGQRAETAASAPRRHC